MKIDMAKTLSEFDVACRMCGEWHTVTANERDVCNWQDGVLIQEAMPYLNADERELLISGTCPVCWIEMCGIAENDIDF